MKYSTLFTSLTVLTAAISFSFFPKPSFPSGEKSVAIAANITSIRPESVAHNHKAEVSATSNIIYNDLKLSDKGLARQALDVAVTGYLSLKEQGKLSNPDLLTIVDFSQSSRNKRFYLLDMKNKELLQNTYVAHGKSSGLDMATDFSNVVGSEKSSLGFYVTKGTYTGKNGFSLRMAGQEQGFNDNAEQRAIVVHGADYVNSGRVQAAFMGRSQGCPALPRENYQQVIDLIKDGTAFFIYYPAASYLESSALLNS